MSSTTIPSTEDLRQDETPGPELSELSRRGLAFYEEKLRAVLEPEHNGKVVAIHVDSGDYEVAGNSPEALRAMHARHPDSPVVIRAVGPEFRHGLVARMLASQMLTRHKK